MSRPDAALALAMLYGFQGKRESRMGSVCVNASGLGSAIFCDIVYHFYTLGPARNANDVLPTGLAVDGPMPADPPMVETALAGAYPRGIRKVSDTSLAESVIRNGVIFNADGVMILSAPATCLAKSFDIQGTKEIYKERVKMLVIVDSGAPQDVKAIRRVLAEFPAPMVFCGKDVGDALPYPATSIVKDFAWAEGHHPVVDAYSAYQPMPYDAPSYDLAGALYAVHPESGLFPLSEPGSLSVDDGGRFRFMAGGGGKVRSLMVDAARKNKIIETYISIASAKPVPPAVRRPKPA
jgi:purine nucleosidase